MADTGSIPVSHQYFTPYTTKTDSKQLKHTPLVHFDDGNCRARGEGIEFCFDSGLPSNTLQAESLLIPKLDGLVRIPPLQKLSSSLDRDRNKNMLLRFRPSPSISAEDAAVVFLATFATLSGGTPEVQNDDFFLALSNDPLQDENNNKEEDVHNRRFSRHRAQHRSMPSFMLAMELGSLFVHDELAAAA